MYSRETVDAVATAGGWVLFHHGALGNDGKGGLYPRAPGEDLANAGIPRYTFLPVGNSGAKPQKNHRQADIWSGPDCLMVGLLLGYYMANHVGVESRTKAMCS